MADTNNWIPEWATDLAAWQWKYSAARMISEGATKGYHIPWTRNLPSHARSFAGLFQKGGITQTATSMLPKNFVFGKAVGSEAANLSWGQSLGHLISTKTTGTTVGGITRASAAKVLVGKVAKLGLRAYGAYLAYEFLVAPAVAGYKTIAHQVKAHRGVELGGYFPDTQASYTSRQRTVQAITSSRLQARSAVGNEAYLMHR